MRPAHVIVLAVLVGLGFGVTYALRGHLAPGIVGGILATVLTYLVVMRFQEQHEQRQAERRRR